MKAVFQSKWTYIAIKVLGFGLLAAYLAVARDFRVSLSWSLAVFGISSAVAWAAVTVLGRIAILNRYLLYPRNGQATRKALTNDEWAHGMAEYQLSNYRIGNVLAIPAEDGFVAVPVLLAGINPLSAIVGGVVFGAIHLGRYNYLECIGKSVSYALITYFVLPQGLLTVILGHGIMDGIAFAILQIGRHQLSKKLRANSADECDAPTDTRGPS